MSLPKKVKIVEVGPRDGLQNEKTVVDAATKVLMCDRLTDAGVPNVEAASFVSPKWVPQMATSAEVMRLIKRRPGTLYSALTPNMKGLEGAIEARANEIVLFGSASDTFSNRNINCSMAEAIERARPVALAAKAQGIKVRGAVSCALGCPYEGDVKPATVADVVKRLADIGCEEIDIADTIGVGTPNKTRAVLEAAAAVYPIERLSGHFHDTYGQALGNIYVSLLTGVSIFHASVAGLGGCPFAKGATGNVATEDVLYLLHGLGIETGIDLDAMAEIGDWISKIVGRPSSSRAGTALMAKRASV